MQQELILDLIAHARDCADNAFCPYSGVPVGAALLALDGTFIGGCNIEPNDRTAYIGALHAAFMSAISQGVTEFQALCIWSEKNPQYPSGIEQSLIAQFAPDMPVIIAMGDNYIQHAAHELIPQIRGVQTYDD